MRGTSQTPKTLCQPASRLASDLLLRLPSRFGARADASSYNWAPRAGSPPRPRGSHSLSRSSVFQRLRTYCSRQISNEWEAHWNHCSPAYVREIRSRKVLLELLVDGNFSLEARNRASWLRHDADSAHHSAHLKAAAAQDHAQQWQLLRAIRA